MSFRPGSILAPQRAATAAISFFTRFRAQFSGAAAARFVARHRTFTVALCIAAALRVIAELGYRWAIWFNDSFDYLAIALHPRPDPVRSGGYPLMLWLFKPFHSLALVTSVQHLLALAGAVLIYALLRHRLGLPGWGATLAVAPLLFDAYQIQLEQLLLGDVLAEFLLVAAAVLVLWRFPGRRSPAAAPAGAPAVLAAAAAGLLFGAAAVTRAVALPLAVVGLVYLLVVRAGWRPLVAAGAAAAAPLAGYAVWFHAVHGVYALDSADGVFLWARSAAFAECGTIKPPPADAWLCPRLPPSRRAASSSQVWQPDSPLDWSRGEVFTPGENAVARRFALRAIAAQPGGYARTVLSGTGRSVTWDRAAYPAAFASDAYKFRDARTRLPAWPVTTGGTGSGGGTGTGATATTRGVARAYSGGDPATRIVKPYSAVMVWYQKYVYLHGTLLGIILLVTPAALAAARLRDRRRARASGPGPAGGGDRTVDRRLSGPACLCWAVAVTLIVIPPMTVDFDYRYVLPAVPFGCAAAALAIRRLREGPTRCNSGGPAAASIRTVRELTATDDLRTPRAAAGSSRE
jgi:hypothetical protein